MSETGPDLAGHARITGRSWSFSHLLLLVGAVAVCLAGLGLGPVTIPVADILAALGGTGDAVHEAIIGQIRGPRVALGVAVGVALALSGAALQGLLRNPLADPGLIGVTGGASVGAVTVIVLGDVLFAGVPDGLRPWLLPVAAFVGAFVVTGFVFLLSRRAGETSMATLILAGVAVNAIAGAFIGAMVFISDDQQLRDLTFWSLGSLGAAGWTLVGIALTASLGSALLLVRMYRALDLFQLGERAAFHAGLDTERIKLQAGVLSALAVGAATAAAGPIGFIGLVAPHMARLMLGAGHRMMLPGAALIGVILILSADLCVRLAVPPAEPPIGLATSLIGGPFFLWLLLSRMRGHA
ncbi:MAG: iron ABC transporter permease [Pseudomonadota bacterium]